MPATNTLARRPRGDAAEPQRGDEERALIALDRFVQATRDSGYKGTASAIAELVDNAIQAGARRIDVQVASSGDPAYPIFVSVLDDGCGMDRGTLQQALQFGGSSRFNDRRGLGRYGMGLPNSSVSQARRVEVYTWQRPGEVIVCYLDVDEIARGALRAVPAPRPATLPPGHLAASPAGTLVVWKRCDRLDHKRISTVARKLDEAIGRVFREFLWGGLEVAINGEAVAPLDPLYLHPEARLKGGRLFGEELAYEVEVPAAEGGEGAAPATSTVTVRFSELPVHEWHKLSNKEKADLGVSKGAGVSVVRAGREVDAGWFFMGKKRKENYDDWWRCEVRFDPALDELFGITHTKQHIRPSEQLQEILAPDLEEIARTLNARARRAHLGVKAQERFAESERLAEAREERLPPLPVRRPAGPSQLEALARSHPALREPAGARPAAPVRYHIVEDSLEGTAFFSPIYEGGAVVLALNPKHPFYRALYKPLVEGEGARDRELRAKLEAVLLAAARSEVERGAAAQKHIADFRRAWSDTIATYLT